MTDSEVKAIYLKIDPASIAENDKKWWAEAIATTRKCLQAKTLVEAAAVLRHAAWGEPCLDTAKEIRGCKPCPHCNGEGFIS